MKRIYLSGSRKRKVAEEKKQKDEEVVKKLPKLTSFFQTFTSLSNNPDGATNVAEDDGGQKIQEPSLAVDNNNDATIPNLAHQGNRNNDSGTWTELTADDISYWTNEGPQKCQHHSSSLENSRRIFQDRKQTRFCSRNIFNGTKANGEKYTREWLLYSPSKGDVYCFVCKLFSSNVSSRLVSGFSDWRNTCIIDQHENSQSHREAMLAYLIRRKGLGLKAQFDDQMEEEFKYWKHVLHRVVSVIQTLAERGLAFRGSDEKFGSVNNGNYLGLLELVAKFDPFLASHISNYGNKGKGNT